MSDSVKVPAYIVPDDMLPPDIDLLLGGSDPALLARFGVSITQFPSIDPQSNGRRFHPPSTSDTPETLFGTKLNRSTYPAPRFIRLTNNREFLIYVDGSCLNNGAIDATAGCGFVFRPASLAHPRGISSLDAHLYEQGSVSFRLETYGPNDTLEAQTSNRAELRAVISVLQYRLWSNEGFQRLVIATDSSYVVEGSSKWVKNWKMNGWRTSQGTAVKNRDLWELLLAELGKWAGKGLEILFWLIPRAWNAEADRFAKTGASLAAVERFTRQNGVMC